MRRATGPILLVVLLAAHASAQPVAPSPASPPAPPSAPPAPNGLSPAPSPPADTPDGPAPPGPTPPGPGAGPPGYYGESGSPPPAGAPTPPPTYEPPPPGYGAIFEPPPPPVARHVAPRTALWAGVRLGWFVPFGYLYAQNVGGPYGFQRIPWSWYAGNGIMLEGDLGARVGRNYTVFGLWERAQLASGSHDTNLYGGQSGADSDYWAIGFQATSDADAVGFLTEIALGYRQARTKWEDGTELQFTDGWLEGRIGFGADIRLNPTFTVSPMLTLGVGSFGNIDRVFPDGGSASVIRPGDAGDSHAWFTLGVAAHADLFGVK